MVEHEYCPYCPLCNPDTAPSLVSQDEIVIGFEAEVGRRDGAEVNPSAIGEALAGLSYELQCDAHRPELNGDQDMFHVALRCYAKDAPGIASEIRNVQGFLGEQLSRMADMLLGNDPASGQFVCDDFDPDPALDPTNFPDEMYLGC